MRSLGVPLQNFELMAKSDVFEDQLLARSEGFRNGDKDDFDHPFML